MFKKLFSSALSVFAPGTLRKIRRYRNRKNIVLISDEKQKFISQNRIKWEETKTNLKNNGFVLVEGFLASYGPNYLIRTGVIAKAIEEELNLLPLVLLNNYLEDEREKIDLYKSFNIDLFKSIKDFQPSFLTTLHHKLLALKFYISIKKAEDLLKLKFKNIIFGDLLYDTILKNVPKESTISKITRRELNYIYQAIQFIVTYNRLITKNDIRLYIATHSQFLEYGLLVRVCLKKNIPVIETTDIQLWLHQYNLFDFDFSNIKYHKYLFGQINTLLNSDHLSINESEKLLANRFNGNLDQSDVRLAYKDKKIYNRNDLCKTLKIENNFPFVFIFAHIFSDSPQSASSGMLYRDYYTWLKETIREICGISGVNWIIKPHPSNTVYNETGMVDRLVEKHNGAGVFLCPNDLNPVSVIEIASAIVTAQGTVGIEFSCMGIPVIVASKPFYSGFGFTIEPNSIEEYNLALKEIVKYPKLTESQKIMAKKVFAAFMLTQQTDTTLINTNILMAVWGGDCQAPSSDKAFDLVNQKLTNIDLREYSLYKETKKLIKDIRI